MVVVRFVAPELTDVYTNFNDIDLAELEASRQAEYDPGALPILLPTQRHFQLELVLITAEQETLVITVPEATFQDVISTVETFYNYIEEKRPEFLYLPDAQKLYQWLIAGIEPELEAREVNSLFTQLQVN